MASNLIVPFYPLKFMGCLEAFVHCASGQLETVEMGTGNRKWKQLNLDVHVN